MLKNDFELSVSEFNSIIAGEQNLTVHSKNQIINSDFEISSSDFNELFQENDSSFPDFVLESIIDHRIVNGKIEYFVQWKGFPQSESTWENEETLQKYKKIIQDYWKTCHKHKSSFEDKNSDNSKPFRIFQMVKFHDQILFFCFKDGTHKYITKDKMKAMYPQQLLDFYESHIQFSDLPTNFVIE